MEYVAYFFLLLFIIMLIRWINGIDNKIIKLEIDLRDMKRKLVLSDGEASPPEKFSGREEASSVQENLKTDIIIPVPLSHTLTESIPPTKHEPPSKPAGSEKEQNLKQKSTRTNVEWEALVGGKILNRIGAVALIIGIGFFLKYAFDNNWITEWMRVVIGIVIGGVCLFGGYRTHRQGLPVFAQGLVGAGIGILYLSIYSAFNFYHLLPQWMAFIVMSLVTILTFVHAIYYNSLATAILGWLGGYLTPFMLSTGHADQIGLFSYLLILNTGLLSITHRKDSWFVLRPLTFISTWFVYLIWHTQYYSDDKLWTTALFLTLFWIMFYISEIIHAQRRKQDLQMLTILFPSINIVIYYFILYEIIKNGRPDLAPFVSFILFFLYLATVFIFRAGNSIGKELIRQYTITALFLLNFFVVQYYDGFTIVFLWSLELFILSVIAKRWQLYYVGWITLALSGLTTMQLYSTQIALEINPLIGAMVIVNERSLAFISLSLTLFGSTYFLNGTGSERIVKMSSNIHYLWCIILFSLIPIELKDYFYLSSSSSADSFTLSISAFFKKDLYLVILWTLYIAFILRFGIVIKNKQLLFSGLVMLAISAVFAPVRAFSYIPIEDYLLVFNLRTGTFLFLLISILIMSRWISEIQKTARIPKETQMIFYISIVLFMLIILSSETIDYFEKLMFRNRSAAAGETELIRLQNLQQLMLSLIWIIYSLALMGLGIWRKIRLLRIISMVLFGCTILKIFTFDLSFLQTLYRIYSFLGLGVILLIVSYLYQRYKDLILKEE